MPWLQGEMIMALEQLLTTKATMDSHQRELALSADITMHQNEAWATEAIIEAKVCCAATIKEAEACEAIHACA